jgi:hypothetical protein
VAEVVYDGGSVLGSLPANITVTNQPPVAVADATNTLKNAAVTINVLANDSDPNGYALTLQSVTQPATARRQSPAQTSFTRRRLVTPAPTRSVTRSSTATSTPRPPP